MKVKQILPPTYLLIAIITMLILHFLAPIFRLFSLPWNMTGLLLLFLGVLINIFADEALRKANTTVKPFQESSSLVTNGVYTISRHPMYLGFMLILVGVAVILGSISPWVIIPVFVITMDLIFIREEEVMLETKFGSSWVNYRKKVHRWI